MATPLEGTERSNRIGIQRVRYTHDAVIDVILVDPAISVNDLASMFGYTQGWMSVVMNTDAFQKRLADRKTETVDPEVRKRFEERVQTLADLSLGIVEEKLRKVPDAKMALQTLELTTRALGFGARVDKNPTINNTFVVAMPEKAATGTDWAKSAKANVLDVTVKEVSNE